MSAGAIGGIVDDKSAFGLGLGATRRYAQLSDNKEIKRENKRRNERRKKKGQKHQKRRGVLGDKVENSNLVWWVLWVDERAGVRVVEGDTVIGVVDGLNQGVVEELFEDVLAELKQRKNFEYSWTKQNAFLLGSFAGKVKKSVSNKWPFSGIKSLVQKFI